MKFIILCKLLYAINKLSLTNTGKTLQFPLHTCKPLTQNKVLFC